MLFNASVLFAVFAVSAKLVSATPPACLLGAVNTQPNPSDLHAICGSHAHAVESNIKSMCGDNTGAAMNAFTSICKANGIAVASMSDSSSKPTTGSSSQKTASSTPMSTMMTMASGSATPVSSMAGSSPTGMSSSASAKPTHNAGGRLHAEEFASLALAAAGLALFL